MTLFPNYHRAPVTFTQAQNATWFDDQGQAYSDFTRDFYPSAKCDLV